MHQIYRSTEQHDLRDSTLGPRLAEVESRIELARELQLAANVATLESEARQLRALINPKPPFVLLQQWEKTIWDAWLCWSRTKQAKFNEFNECLIPHEVMELIKECLGQNYFDEMEIQVGRDRVIWFHESVPLKGCHNQCALFGYHTAADEWYLLARWNKDDKPLPSFEEALSLLNNARPRKAQRVKFGLSVGLFLISAFCALFYLVDVCKHVSWLALLAMVLVPIIFQLGMKFRKASLAYGWDVLTQALKTMEKQGHLPRQLPSPKTSWREGEVSEIKPSGQPMFS